MPAKPRESDNAFSSSPIHFGQEQRESCFIVASYGTGGHRHEIRKSPTEVATRTHQHEPILWAVQERNHHPPCVVVEQVSYPSSPFGCRQQDVTRPTALQHRSLHR